MTISAHRASQGLLDLYLPEYNFGHSYDTVVDSGDIDTVYAIARDVDLSKSKIIPLLFRLRGLPVEKLNARAFTARMGWSDVEETPPTEFLIGYWRSRRVERIVDREQFVSRTPRATQKVLFNFRFRSLGGNQVKIETETRVLCIGSASKLRFRIYWLAIKPFSGLIRREVLKIIKSEAEARVRGKVTT